MVKTISAHTESNDLILRPSRKLQLIQYSEGGHQYTFNNVSAAKYICLYRVPQWYNFQKGRKSNQIFKSANFVDMQFVDRPPLLPVAEFIDL
jgi:hypothetical protein